jgi:quinoprotein relay system zinc metallohydrolase 2
LNLLVFCCLSFTASATEQPGALTLTEVAPGAYAHFGQISLATRSNAGDIANLGVIVGRDAVAVIDTGGSVAVGSRLRAAVRAITSKPIRYVLNTHDHPDHVFGNAAFDSGAVFVGHHNLPDALKQRAPYYLRSFRDVLGTDAIAQVRIIPPTLLVEDERVLDLGDRRIRLVAWGRAHTDCDLAVLDETSSVLFAGDLVFQDHVPVLDGSVKNWLAILPKLAEMRARFVVPGHGPSASPWPQALNDERRYLQALADDARRQIAAGTPMQQAVARVGQSESGRWLLFGDYNPRNATAALSELEWE